MKNRLLFIRRGIRLSLLKWFGICILSLMPVMSFATHNRAGEITYKPVCPPGTTPCLEYEITITLYTKCDGGVSADRCEITVNMGNGDSLILPRVNGNSQQNPCPNQAPCSGHQNQGVVIAPGIKKSIYQGRYTFNGAYKYWISVDDKNRNAGILNIPNSDQISFHVSTMIFINTALGGSNASPVLTNPPVDNACANVCFYHNPGAYDPDGDSLSYELVECTGVDQNGMPLTGYQLPHIVGGGNLSLDPITGDLVWCSPQKQGEYNVAIKIREWRKQRGGTKYYEVGATIRDMQIEVEGNCFNTPPEIKSIKDTCILAGSLLNFTVTATDVSTSDKVTITAGGDSPPKSGPFAANPAATFTSIPSNPPATDTARGYFSWQTSIDMARTQPYFVTFKASDNNQNPLVSFISVSIRLVAPAPTNVKAVPSGTSMHVSWDPGPGANVSEYRIYRLDGSCSNWKPGPCETGLPSYTGYKHIGTVNANTTSFIDNNKGQGLIHGLSYSYRVVAILSDGGMSYASDEVCEKLKRDVPVITHVDVLSTGPSDNIEVKWVKPLADSNNLDTNKITGPYEFRLYRAEGFSGTTYTLVASFSSPYFATLNATSFTDAGLNTAAIPYNYKLEFYHSSPAAFIGATRRASSVYLSLTPADNSMILLWDEDVPWSNYMYDVYRKDQGVWTKIAATPLQTYTDPGLANGSTYCYYVESFGQYSDTTIIPRPFINTSEEKCASPVDTEKPCPPVLSVNSNCDGLRNILTWNNPNNTCANDVTGYKIYYAPFEGDPWQFLAEIFNLSDTTFTHDSVSYQDIPSLAGCYAVTAVDSFQNESLYSNRVCIDNDSVCGLQYNLPNVFTPNGDGRNDLYTPVKPYKFVMDIDMKIYDRWGLLMFQTTDPEINWNGFSMDTKKSCPAGVYYYVCTVNFIRVKGIQPVTLKGFIHLLDPRGNPQSK